MRRLRVIEAAVLLVAAKAAIRLLPFRWLVPVFSRRPAARTPSNPAGVVKDIQAAIASATRRLPGEFACFPRAVAAQGMLRRRGLATTLYYGAATGPDEGLTAHVWLCYGATGVLGHEMADRFRVAASFAPAGTR